MSDAAAILASAERVRERLAATDDPDAFAMAQALRAWVGGSDFDAALGLFPGWRTRVRLTQRARALAALIPIHTALDDSDLARWILDGIRRVAHHDIRPPGIDGILHDLAQLDSELSLRQWRRAIRGHRTR